MLIGIDARYGLRKNRRGIGNYIYYLLREFQKLQPRGFRFILYADKAADPAVVKCFQKDPFRTRILPIANPVWWEQIALPLAARRDKVDLLHCTSNIAPAFFKTCRMVTTIHDVIEFHRQEFDDAKLPFRHRLVRAYRNSVLPKGARQSDLIITDAAFSRDDIAATLRVNPAKIRVIYMATSRDKEKAKQVTRGTLLTELGIKNSYIFALGAVDRRKNTARLIEAYRRLRAETHTEALLVVAGIEKPEIFAPLSGDGVFLFGFLPDETVAALYRHALFFVYPSLYEGFGLPVLEAMESDTPVLCSATTAVGEIAGDAALKFDPRDAVGLAAKMKLLLEDTALRAELAKKGCARAKEFSWERCARETLSVYCEALGKTQMKTPERFSSGASTPPGIT
jgi:glycosyltransferase involved in cell wall biosynthesis